MCVLKCLRSHTHVAARTDMQFRAWQVELYKTPVIHISVHVCDGARPTAHVMLSVGWRVRKSVGLSRDKAVIMADDDKDHAHFHIAINRFGPDGRAVSDSKSFAKIDSVLRRIEAERGWKAVEGRNAPSPATGARMQGHKPSRDPYQLEVPERVKTALLTATSWKDLHKEIRAAGWTFEIVQKGKGSGAL